MSGLVNRLKSWVAGEDLEEEMYHIDSEFETEDMLYAPQHQQEILTERPTARKRSQKGLKVVDHPSGQATQVMVMEPKNFEESLEIVDHLREKKSVILNLHLLDTSQAQRVVDFLSGATHAIDGNQQRIGDGVFIFTPNSVAISTEQPQQQQHNPMDFSTEAFWTQ